MTAWRIFVVVVCDTFNALLLMPCAFLGRHYLWARVSLLASKLCVEAGGVGGVSRQGFFEEP